MGENVLVGAGGAGHASTGGGAGGGAGHAGAGRARDMHVRRGRKACERRRGHGTCRCGRKGSGDANASPGRKGGANAGVLGPVRESATWSQLKLPFRLEVAGFSELPRAWDSGLSLATHNSHALRLGGIARPGPCNTPERGTRRGPVTPLFPGSSRSTPKSRQSWERGPLGPATIPCVVESNGEGTFRDENSLEAAQNGEKIHIFSPLFKHQTRHRERKK